MVKRKFAAFFLLFLIAIICVMMNTGGGTMWPGVRYEVYFMLVRQTFPVCACYIDTPGEEENFQSEIALQIESELTLESVLAMEAADENTVAEEVGQDEPLMSEEEIVNEALAEESGIEKKNEISMDQLKDFNYLIDNFYKVDRSTTISGAELNAENFLSQDMKLKGTAETPQILIYHTHSQESYADSVPGASETSVVGVGDYLAKILTEQYGLNVLHHTGEYDVSDRDHAYAKAGPALEQILKENPSIEVVIDLHRDGVSEGTRLVTDIGGKQTANIMFFNGLSRTTATGDIAYLYNPNLGANLAFSFQLQLTAAEYYPGFTRPVYLKGYRYNMHYCPRSLLVEVGAQTNTVQEAMNAMEPLADILHKVLCG